MSEETVEITIRVPKRLMDILEAENYFGWSKESFWVAAAKTRKSCDKNDMDIKDCQAIEAKYGPIGVVAFDLGRKLAT